MHFKKLRTRMIAHIIWIVILVTLVTFYFVYQTQQDALKRHLMKDGEVFADVIDEVFLKIMQQHKKGEKLPHFLDTMVELEHIKKIRIVKPDGHITFSSDLDEIGIIIQGKQFENFMRSSFDIITFAQPTKWRNVFVRFTKFQNKKSCQQCHDKSQRVNGMLWIETTERKLISAFKSKYFGLGIIAIVVIIVLSLATIFLFVRSVDRPVKTLMKTMNRLERGDFSARVNIIGRDEIGQLAKATNTLADKLQKAKEHLEEHHQQELQQAESLAKIGKMAAGLAHEIKNPISGIVFAINSMLRETDPNDSRREIYEEIVRQASRVEQNLESLLTFARQSRLELVSTDLNNLIERILLFVRQQSNMKRIKIVSDLDFNLPEALIDPKQVEQVFMNLIINAVHAMPDGGNLTVSTRFDILKNSVRILVEDTGEGIADEIRDQLFHPFFTTKTKGVGLGLTLCQEIIARHYGTITFKSKVGAGTIFVVDLPVNISEIL